MSDKLKGSIVQDGVKTLAAFEVIQTLDYFIKSKLMERFKMYGLIHSFLFLIIFMISNLIELKFKKD